jgi:hypothetical protein
MVGAMAAQLLLSIALVAPTIVADALSAGVSRTSQRNGATAFLATNEVENSQANNAYPFLAATETPTLSEFWKGSLMQEGDSVVDSLCPVKGGTGTIISDKEKYEKECDKGNLMPIVDPGSKGTILDVDMKDKAVYFKAANGEKGWVPIVVLKGMKYCLGGRPTTTTAKMTTAKPTAAKVESKPVVASLGEVDTKMLVASLVEVAKGLQLEDKSAWKVAQSTKSECNKTARTLDLSLDKGKRALEMAQDDYQKTSAQIQALQASKSELQGQIASTNGDVNNLQAKLKKMRQDKGLLKKQAAKSLRQIESVIAKTYQRENAAHRHAPTAMQKKVSSLEELSRGLSFVQTDDGTDGEVTENHESEKKAETKHAPSLVLRADKQAVVKASAETQRGFDEEEKKILDLVKVKRMKLQDLDDELADLQPAISNKLKQAMEINRTLDAATRGMERDQDLRAIEKKKCKVIADGLGAQKNKRAVVVNDVSMASKLIERMDTAMFLAKDLQGLQKSVPSFLQIDESAVPEAAEVPAPRSFVQDGEGLQEIVED